MDIEIRFLRRQKIGRREIRRIRTLLGKIIPEFSDR
jgi:hypothetical protein